MCRPQFIMNHGDLIFLIAIWCKWDVLRTKVQTLFPVSYTHLFPNPHQPYLANDLLYIVGRPGDTFKNLSKEFDMRQRKLRKYSDLYKGYVLKPGDIIYLDKKHRRADKEHIVHVVRGGESMNSISQDVYKRQAGYQ